MSIQVEAICPPAQGDNPAAFMPVMEGPDRRVMVLRCTVESWPPL
jgi:hypothetical protein